MRLKTGVRILGLRPELVLGLVIADSVYIKHKQDCVVTSVVEGTHSRASIHYAGGAFDLRTRNISEEILDILVSDLDAALGDDFDVVKESDHLHCEYQPKQSY